MTPIPEHIEILIKHGALFVANHSGGKDSQAMLAYLKAFVPADQLVIVHAHLPEVEWDGTEEFIRKYAGGTPVHVCTAVKTFFEMVVRRGMWPSSGTRQCTSDLKRGPLEKLIRQLSKDTGRHRIVNCMGMRAQESVSRSKKKPFKYSVRNSVAGREWFDWLPIHEWSTKDVFDMISLAGQKPFWTYAEGMKRKSCSFCIMACDSDLKIAARLRPKLLEQIVSIEKEIGHTLKMPKKGKTVNLDEYIKNCA